MRYARLENNIVMEVIDFDPEGIFSNELIFVECPDDTQQRHVYNEEINEFNPPEEVPCIPTKEDILAELSRLDLIVPRVLEDIISQGNFTIHQSKLDIIAKKEELREQLNSLE